MSQAPPPDRPISADQDVAAYLDSLPEGMGGLARRLGIVIEEASAQRVTGYMPVSGNTQPFGLLHGGASVSLAETLGSVGSGIHAWPDRVAVGVDVNATHHRSARAGVVTGVATPLHLGRSATCYEIVVSDERGRRVCTARLTCTLLPAPPPADG
jgi:uncharacterized protein (TIGR00369 family)